MGYGPEVNAFMSIAEYDDLDDAEQVLVGVCDLLGKRGDNFLRRTEEKALKLAELARAIRTRRENA